MQKIAKMFMTALVGALIDKVAKPLIAYIKEEIDYYRMKREVAKKVKAYVEAKTDQEITDSLNNMP